MKELRKIQAFKKVNNALRTRNGSGITYVHDLFLNDLILVYKKKKGWKGLYKFLGIEGKTVKALIKENVVRMFRSILVRL